MCCSITMYVHAWSMVRFSFGLNITPYQEIMCNTKTQRQCTVLMVCGYQGLLHDPSNCDWTVFNEGAIEEA